MKTIIFFFVMIFLTSVFNISLFAQGVVLEGSDSEAGDQFGFSVAISGDNAIVGALFHGLNFTDDEAGAAYIYTRSGVNWNETVKLTASDASSYNNERFGTSVSIDGNYAAVGAYRMDSDTGAVYIFHKDSGGTDNWGEVNKISPADGESGDFFGYDVSISGSLLVVGAIGESGTGAAYIYSRSGATWSEDTKIFASDSAANDNFGWSTSLDGNYAIVGAPDNDSLGIGFPSGAAYIFYKDEGGTDNWGEQADIFPNVGGTSSMGFSVDIDGNRAITGSYSEPTGAPSNSGAAYIYTRSGSTWSLDQKIQASDITAEDQFGYSVAISGDYVVAGAFGADSSGITNSGAIYAFLYNGSSWNETSITYSSVPDTNGQLGADVDIDGLYAIAGMPQGIPSESDSGKAFIFESLNDLALPVELNIFAGSSVDGGIELFWNTASELGNLGFKIERAEEKNGQYIEIATFKSNPDLFGQINSSVGADYSFIDYDAVIEKSYWYKLYDVSVSGSVNMHGPIKVFNSSVLSDFSLNPAYPNPFNPSTKISFRVPGETNDFVKINIYNSIGQKIKTLVNRNLDAGAYEYIWQGISDSGQRVTSGIYYVVVDWSNKQFVEKIILIK